MKRSLAAVIIPLLCLTAALAQTNRDRHAQREGVADTYWRDEKTGDWLLGVGRSHVVYDCKVWSITSQTERRGAFTINASNGSDNITINIGREKNGLRTVNVGKKKTVCGMIAGDILPDYPTRDNATTLADNGYRMGDSVTIIGWYKDMPREMWQMGSEFEAAYTSVFIDEEKRYHTKIDSLGRFTLRMPVENTQMLYCDWKRTHMAFVAEPGETYFLMRDFAVNKTLVMGRNARLQNEWLGHCLPVDRGNYQEVGRMGGIMKYMAHCDSLRNDALARLDTECKRYPTLSARYENLYRQLILAGVGSSLMQARFMVPKFRLPKEYVDYVTEHYWNKIEEPYTAWANDYTTFFRDYSDNMERNLSVSVVVDENQLREALLEAGKAGKITLSDADKTLMDEYVASAKVYHKQYEEATDSLKKGVEEAFQNSDVVKRMQQLVTRDDVMGAIMTFVETCSYKKLLAATDSLGWSQIQKDIFLSTKLYKVIDHDREPLSPSMMRFANENISIEAARQALHEQNGKYEAIHNQTLSTDNLKSSDDVRGLTEGGQILQKILEPYRGKIVLLDIWGTWCGPCKDALSHSQEEYERLRDYPMVYLYLANHSPEDSWKNVIKEYNVTGDNVAHYNLPEAQQKAVENHVRINGYPTFRLFNRQGQLLDVDADPRDLDTLETLIKGLMEQ